MTGLCLKLSGQNDSIIHHLRIDSITLKTKIEQTLIRSPQHKYYIYAEAWSFLIRGAGLHFERNIINRPFYADYFDFSLGSYYDDAWVYNYSNLQGRYSLITSMYYVFLKKKRHICYELDLGSVASIGDGNARAALQKRQTVSKILISTYIGVGIRYNFKKIPIQIRITANSLYFFKGEELIPILPSFSIGYSFIKINNDEKNKKSTTDSFPY